MKKSQESREKYKESSFLGAKFTLSIPIFLFFHLSKKNKKDFHFYRGRNTFIFRTF